MGSPDVTPDRIRGSPGQVPMALNKAACSSWKSQLNSTSAFPCPVAAPQVERFPSYQGLTEGIRNNYRGKENVKLANSVMWEACDKNSALIPQVSAG